ncbi:sarcosine oxidase subunit gamma [uncultured Litoreibacter sp.]|uniref:sarcosine oxidase subunit gamma n=1 Tax=uncultured Litoreibacter sp. TaxID=1392394 RepID=UPI002632C04B|nr:sarcosine oxidase subunit gamma family protein [uncultured Litoreibacter sp.]
MSNAVSALQGVTYEGYVTVTEMGLRGMITLRGDLSSAKLKKAVKAVSGVDVPGVNSCVLKGDQAVAWMSPDELLLMCPHDRADTAVEKLSTALKGQHFLAANVSDARAVFQVQGQAAREVIAKLAPVDMSPDAFPAGHFRRTRLAQTPAAFYMPDAQTVELICFRSVAGYVFDLLSRAATLGAEVEYF